MLNMAKSKLISLIFIVYTIFMSSIKSIYCKNSNNLLTKQTALFVFGDSVFDAGNNNYIDTFSRFRSNIYPYGQTTFKSPTGRVSDGRIIPDFIAEYGRLPLIPPNLQPSNGVNQFTYGVNFASGGAGALIETFPGTVISLGTQLNNFKNVEKMLREELGDEETKRILSRAVYFFHIGTNDYLYPTLIANSSIFQSNSKQNYVDFVINNITSVIKEVYKLGGRKFGLMNIGPYDCAPGTLIVNRERTGTCFKPLTEMIELHNKKLPNVLKRLERQLSGFKYVFHDYHTSLSQRMDNPIKYGFKEGIKACCGSGPLRGINTCGGKFGGTQDYELCENVNDYMFFDAFHFTEKVHRQIAEIIWDGPVNVTGPYYSLKTFFEV